MADAFADCIDEGSIRLRLLADADAPALFGVFSDPDVMRYWSAPPMTDPAQAAQMVRDAQAAYATGESLRIGVERKCDAALVGTCSLFAFHATSRRAELGYALGRSYWGQGLMHAALRALVRHAFERIGLQRLEADIDPRNAASARSLERLGFVREGLLRDRWIVNGEVSDSAYYGLLRSDWDASRSRGAASGAIA